MFVVRSGNHLFFFDVVLFGQTKKNGASIQEFRPYGKLHSVADTPAVINYDKLRMEWYTDGKLHRNSGPAVIVFDKSGRIIERKFYKNGKSTDKELGDDGVEILKIKKLEDCVKKCSAKLGLSEERVAKVVLANTNKLS